MQVLAEAFNLFNHSNFTGYNTTKFNAPIATLANSTTPIVLTTATNALGPTFGLPSQDGGQPDGTGARRFQVGLKLNF